MLALVPFKLLSDVRVLRFRVEAADAPSAGCRAGEAVPLPEGVASVLESSAALFSITVLLVDATGVGMGALREICDRRYSPDNCLFSRLFICKEV